MNRLFTIFSLFAYFSVFSSVYGQDELPDEIKNMLMEIMSTICDTSAALPAPKKHVIDNCESNIPLVLRFIYNRCIRQSMDVEEIDQPFPCYRIMPGSDKLKQCMDKWARRGGWVGIDVPAIRARVLTNYAYCMQGVV